MERTGQAGGSGQGGQEGKQDGKGTGKEGGNTKRAPVLNEPEPSEKRQLPTLPPGGAVPSAMAGLTSLFGMGRGGTPPL